MKFPRLTTRRLMILVALTALTLSLALWLQEHRERFRTVMIRHSLDWLEWGRLQQTEEAKQWGSSHRSMMVKYRELANHPWMPVGTDPVEPE